MDKKITTSAPLQKLTVLLLLSLFVRLAVAQDVLNLSIEQLLEVKVLSASRHEQKSSEIAGSPQLVKADEIRAAGVRNLGEALALFGVVHLHSDGIYTRLGVRGFLRTGDFNARILLLLDGRRINEMAYDGAYLGKEGPIDVSLIDRLEFIPGPGSSVYGSNAFFGVINIITKKAKDQPAAHAGFEIAEGHKQRYEGGLALKFDHGASDLLQVSHCASPGRQRSAQELACTANDLPAGRDAEWANRFYGCYDLDALRVSVVYVNREVNNANSVYFTQPSAVQPNRDRLASVDVAYSIEATPTLTLAMHLGASDYAFKSYNLNEPADGVTTDNVQISHAHWVDADIKAIAKWRLDSILVAGVEITRVSNLDFKVISSSMQKVLVDQQSQFTRWGVYAQNDWTAVSPFTLSLGLRLDGRTGRDSVPSPRIGAVYRASPTSVLKLQLGVAFRNPNAYELYHNATEIGYRTNPSIRAERVRSKELTFETKFGAGASLRLSGFNNKVDKLIDFLTDPKDDALVFSNIESATVNGAQADMYVVQRDGWRACISATVQCGTENSGSGGGNKILGNSPKNLAHITLFTPRWQAITGNVGTLSGSVIWQYMGAQQGRDAALGGSDIVNATLVADNLFSGMSAQLGIKNLFDRAYVYPLDDEFVQAAERGSTRVFGFGAKVNLK